MVKLSIIVPCYNEEKNIPILLERFKEVFLDQDAELVIVDNGSLDNTKSVLKRELKKKEYGFVKVVSVKKNIGYGFGILSGLRAARGEIFGWTHADLQTDPADTIRGYKLLLEQKDPTRVFVKGGRRGRRLFDLLFTFGMQTIASIVLGKVLSDINAQPKIFHKLFFEKIEKNAPNDFSLDLYFMYMAKKNEVKIITFPVDFKKRIHGQSSWAFSFKSKYKTILRTIKYIFKLRRALVESESR